MNYINVNHSPLLERIQEALRLRGWHLTEALDNWHRGRTKLTTFYVIDCNGDVLEPYWSLTDLAVDLQVIRRGEIVDGCDWSMTAGVSGRFHGPVTQAQLDAIGELVGGNKVNLSEYTKSYQERSYNTGRRKPLPLCISSGKFFIVQ